MQLAIPHAPRPVRLRQGPGAVTRLLVTAVAGALFATLLIGLAVWAGRARLMDRDFAQRAVRVTGKVSQVQ